MAVLRERGRGPRSMPRQGSRGPRPRILFERPQHNATLWRPLNEHALRFSESQVQDVWDRVMTASPKAWRALERESGPFQEELSGFVVGFTFERGPDASELARECMVAIYAVFREYCSEFALVAEASIKAQWKRSKSSMEDFRALADAGEPIGQVLVGSPQPQLLAVVLDALLELDEEDEPESIELDEDEFWHVLAVLDTVITVLDAHAEPAPAP
jgi:hypothetical protein